VEGREEEKKVRRQGNRKTGRKRCKGDIDIRRSRYKENLIRTAARSLSRRDVFGQSVVNGNETRHCGAHSLWTIAYYGGDCLPRAHVALGHNYITYPRFAPRRTGPALTHCYRERDYGSSAGVPIAIAGDEGAIDFGEHPADELLNTRYLLSDNNMSRNFSFRIATQSFKIVVFDKFFCIKYSFLQFVINKRFTIS